MMNFPYQYQVTASANVEGEISMNSAGLPEFSSAAPKEFGGSGDRWSPETLLVAALGDCYILTFRAVAAAMKINWVTINCDVQGTLARVEGKTRFTEFVLRVRLKVPADTDKDRTHVVLQKTEGGCFVSNSLSAQIRIEPEILFA